MPKLPANKQVSKRRTNNWKPGESGNPAGAPKRGESWAEIIKQIGDMPVEDVIQMIAGWLPTLKKAPRGITMKQLVVIRAYVGLANEPAASLLNAFMDRSEGKTAEKVEQSGEVRVVIEYADEDTVAPIAPGAVADQSGAEEA